jgi:hypothetical protein
LGQQSDGGSSVISTVPAAYSAKLGSLTATISDRTVTLNWTRPADTGGLPLIGYMISRCWYAASVYCDMSNSNYVTHYWNYAFRGVNDPITGIAFVGPDATSFTFTADTADFYRVVPVTGTGVWTGTSGGVYSNFPNASMVYAAWWGVPSQVNGMKVTTSSPGGAGAANSMLYFDWTAPTVLGNGTITGYDVEQSNDGGLTWTALGRTRLTSQYVSGVPSGASVTLRVRAVNEYGVGPWSSVTSSWTANPTSPRTPAITVVGGRMTFNWTAPESTSGMGIQGYEVQFNLNGTWGTYAGTGAGFTATSLQWNAPNNT